MNRLLGVIASGFISVFPAIAQDTTLTGSVSWGGGGAESYKAVVLTEYGFHLTTAGEGIRVISSAGMLVKTGAADALGAAMFVSGDEAFSYGIELRYRHWLGEHHSFDFGVGLPLYSEDYGSGWIASPYFLVRWNPADWCGLSIRPEYRRSTSDYYSPETGGHYLSAGSGEWQVSGGIEIGGVTGFVLQAVTAVTVGIIAATWSGPF